VFSLVDFGMYCLVVYFDGELRYQQLLH